MCQNSTGLRGSVDRDQTPCVAASDLGLHCLLWAVSPKKITVIMVITNESTYLYSVHGDGFLVLQPIQSAKRNIGP